MSHRRGKDLLFAICATGALVLAHAVNAAAQRPSPPPPQPKQSPNAPVSQNVPQGLDGPPLTPDTSKASYDAQNEQEIRLGVQRLYALVTELKSEVDRTNSRVVLNTSVVKHAQDIEKLAKQIKDRARK
jgi:hypothetical protein